MNPTKAVCVLNWPRVILPGLTLLLFLAVTGLTFGQAPEQAPEQAPGQTPNINQPIKYSTTALTGSHPFLNVLCKFSDVSQEPHTVAYFNNLLNDPVAGELVYWREVSYGALNLTGSATTSRWYTLPGNKAAYISATDNTPNWTKLRQDCTSVAAAEINNTYDGLNLIFNDVLTLGSDGGPAQGSQQFFSAGGASSRIWRVTWNPPWAYGPYQNFSAGIAGLTQQMGHSFGLSSSADGLGTPAANGWDLMSDPWDNCATTASPTFGCLGQHIIAWHKDKLGWLPANRKFTYSGTAPATLTLERIAQPGSTNYLMAVVPVPGSNTHFYTVEARQLTGFDKRLRANSVIIHDVDTSRSSETQARVVGSDGYAGAEWLPDGPSFQDSANNIEIRVDAATTTGFTVTINPAPPPAATGQLFANTVSSHQIDLSWTDNSTDETGFILQRSLDNGATWPTTFNIGPSNGSGSQVAFSDTGLLPSTVYYYRVAATNGSSRSAYSNVASAATRPNPPGDLQALALSASQIRLDWSSPANPDSYSLERTFTPAAGSSWSVISGTLSGSNRTYTDTGLTVNQTYYYRLRDNQNGVYSDYSNIVSATTTSQLIVTQPADNGNINAPNTFSWAIDQVNRQAGTIILLAPSPGPTITLNAPLPAPIPANVTLLGKCASGPQVIIRGSPQTAASFSLTNGGITLYGIRLSGFNGPQLVAGSGNNKLRCVAASRT